MRDTNVKRRTWGILLALYLVLLVYFLLFCKAFGRTPGQGGLRFNLMPFREIRRFHTYWKQVGLMSAVLNMAGNLLGFVPLGFLLPLVSRRMRSCVRTVETGFLVTFVLEFLQLVLRAGIFDVDDMLLNTLGTLVGYIVYLMYIRFRRYNIYG